jgi:hypothetical protein
MPFLAVTHVTVSVPGPLREAESYYCSLFDLSVAWREPVPDGAPFDLPWEALGQAGAEPVIALLHSGEFRLAVTVSRTPLSRGVLDHVGLQVALETLRAVRERALGLGVQVVSSREDELFDFIDRFGAEWELDTRSFADPTAIVEMKRDRAAQPPVSANH